MSFSSAYAAVSNADTNSRMENRRAIQQQAELYSKGYNADGTPMQSASNTEDIKAKETQAKLDAVTADLKALQSKQNADAITNIVSNVIDGNFDDALKDWNLTPNLKETFKTKPSLDTQDIDVVNFGNPNDLKQLRDMGVNTDNIESDPKLQDALKRSFLRVQGLNGKWRVVPVDSIVKQTNSYNLFNKQQKDMYNRSVREINATLKGKPQESLDIEDAVNDLALDTAEVNKDKITQDKDLNKAIESGDKNKILDTYLKNNPKELLELQKFNSRIAAQKEGSGRKDLLGQLKEAFEGQFPKGSKPSTEEVRKFYKDSLTRLMGGTPQVREDKDVYDMTNAADIGKQLVAGKSVDSETRYNAEKQFINTKGYDSYKPLVNDFNKKYITYKVATDLGNELDTAIKTGKYESGPLVSAMHSLAKYTPDQLRGFIQEPDKFSTRLGIDTELSNYLAQELKNISGTAVSDDEFMRRMRDTIGSSYYNEKTKQLVFKNALDYKAKDLIAEGEVLVKGGMTGDVFDKVSELKNYNDTKSEDSTSDIEVGIVVNGYKYLGGNSQDPKSWEKVK